MSTIALTWNEIRSVTTEPLFPATSRHVAPQSTVQSSHLGSCHWSPPAGWGGGEESFSPTAVLFLEMCPIGCETGLKPTT